VSGYKTRIIKVQVGGAACSSRVLSDRQQFADPNGHGRCMGISSGQWSLFGQSWPVGRLVAQSMLAIDITGKRLLELGCGIGLASLVLQRRGANEVASDVHRWADSFLADNAALNQLPAVHYRHIRWHRAMPALGAFDMFVASDVLYEPDQAAMVASIVERPAKPHAEVIVSDPGRGNSAPFTRMLTMLGFEATQMRCAMDDDDLDLGRGNLMHCLRTSNAARHHSGATYGSAPHARPTQSDV
jgi:2-polyprenyl-3-methyl-5-hydroxy-6-metoxy-1,4-benzoquinol methylase